jgi:hypothetical protein
MTHTQTVQIIDRSAITDDVGVSYAPTLSFAKNYANGTGADQADRVYGPRRRTIANSGTPDTLDLAGGTLFMPGSDTAVTFVEITSITIVNLSTVQVLTVGGGTNPLTTWVAASGDGIKIRPGGCFHLSCADATGYAVTAGTGDIIQVATDGGTNVLYDIKITGRSA